MTSQYVQDMKAKEIPQGTYHIARWHANGKLWISPEYFSADKRDMLAEAAAWNAKPDPAGVRKTSPYFVWDAKSWEAEQARSKAQSDPNKIK